MKCVFYETSLPNGFEERSFFSKEMPYTINIKHFQAEDIVPLHYAETIEILLCDGLCGEFRISGERFSLGGKQLLVVPPYTVHSNNIRSGDGLMYIFKISLRDFSYYVNLKNYLDICGCQPEMFLYQCPEYDEVLAIVRALIENDGDLPQCLPYVLRLFYLLSRHVDRQRDASALDSPLKDSSLQELITFTQQNYSRKISIEEVARITGYSKYHFCSRFKALTGMTYLNYLNSVRVSHACLMLANGESVQSVCRSTGFESPSHFIQVFKKIQHITPRQYALQQRQTQAKEP